MTSSTVATSTQLTKKQKKALAFRQKSKAHSTSSSTKTRAKNELTEGAANEDILVPAVEDQNLISGRDSQMESGGMDGTGREGKKKAAVKVMVESDRDRGKEGQKRERGPGIQGKGKDAKRKRGLDELVDSREGSGRKEKKRKTTTEAEGETGKWEDEQVEDEDESDRQNEWEDEDVSEDGKRVKRRGKEKQRFILFIGNLKYTTTAETIKGHFSACDPPPTAVRLLTPKKSSTGKTTNKTKGCAFLEFETHSTVQQALKLHHSLLDGRMINVELTAGGGGKSEKRLAKLRERNKALLGQRVKKTRTVGQEAEDDSITPKPQRYSATSGVDQPPIATKRTWSVGGTAEDKTHRGGKKNQRIVKSRKSRQKEWATGVNAIPVG